MSWLLNLSPSSSVILRLDGNFWSVIMDLQGKTIYDYMVQWLDSAENSM